MSKLLWDLFGNRIYETGIDRGVLFLKNDHENSYTKGVVWNGLTAINENPTGGEVTNQYANNKKYIEESSVEGYSATIEAYTYPPEFEICDGTVAVLSGLLISQQKRTKFGMCYRTKIGNDTLGTDYGYFIHIIYNASATPSDKGYSTINDSPEPISFSWEITTKPLEVSGFKSTGHIVLDSRKLDPIRFMILESELYGTDDSDSRLLSIDEIFDLFGVYGPPREIYADEVYY